MSLYKTAVQKVAQLLRDSEIIQADTHVSRRDQMRPADLIKIKAKLGPSFFRGQLTARTRRYKLSLLTDTELAVARAHGWTA
jgi:hypothetical protein